MKISKNIVETVFYQVASNVIAIICIVIAIITSLILWQNVSSVVRSEYPDACVQEQEQEQETTKSPIDGERKTVLVTVAVDRKNSRGVIHVWSDTIVTRDINAIDGIIAVEISSYSLPAFVYVDARYDVHKVAVKLEKLLLAYDVDVPKGSEW